MNTKDWFNSDYYHTLYDYRNESEAWLFLNNLLIQLQIPEKSKIWDLCCGNGRHSAFLNSKNMIVTGTDLSENNIHCASSRNLANAAFYVHDMRHMFYSNAFDYVLNLFTSFGYFDSINDDKRVLRNVFYALKPGGLFILDYLNAPHVINTLVKEEQIEKKNIIFSVQRIYDGEFIRKKIKVSDKDKDLFFEEKVRAFEAWQIIDLAQKCGLKHLNTWGNYTLDNYNNKSTRMILCFKK
jgi:SAM-dependent methyltransferase